MEGFLIFICFDLSTDEISYLGIQLGSVVAWIRYGAKNDDSQV